MCHLFWRHAKVNANGSSCQSIVYIVCANELCLHFLPDSLFHAPTEMQEGVAIQHLAFHIIALSWTPVSICFQTFRYIEQIFIVTIEKNIATCFRAEIIVKLSLRMDNALETSKAFQVSLTNIRN